MCLYGSVYTSVGLCRGHEDYWNAIAEELSEQSVGEGWGIEAPVLSVIYCNS